MDYKRLRGSLRKFCRLIFLACFVSALGYAQTTTNIVAIPSTLTAEGISPIDKSLVEKVSRYTASRAAQFLSWQPKKREMLVATRFGETVQVHRVAQPNGARTQLTFFPDRVSSAWFEPSEGNYFVFLKDQAGDENFHLYRQDFAAGDFVQLTSATEIDSVDSVKWSPSGATLFYIGVKLKEGEAKICRSNPSNPAENKCQNTLKGILWQITDVSPDNTKLLLYEYVATGKSAVHLLDLSSGKLERITPDVNSVFGDAVFSADGKGVFLSSNDGGEFAYPAFLDLATKQIRRIFPEKQAELEAFALSRDGKRMACVYNENGNSRLSVWDLKINKETVAPQLPVGVITQLQWLSPDELGFNLETARFPADIYAYNLRNKKLERWTTSETGGINTSGFREAELIKWRSFDGKMIAGILNRPPDAKSKKMPVLIDVHGGPQTESRPTYAGRYNYLLKEMGIAVIFPNVRGSSGFGKSFMDADNKERRGDAVKDLQALLDWIKTQPDLDASRVVVRGESYGGFLALSLGLAESNRIKGVIATSPIVSVSRYISKSPESLQGYLRAEYGDERDAGQIGFLDKMSPLNNEEKWRLPLLLAVGKRDARVPTEAVEQLQANLRKRNVPVAYLVAANEGHVWRNKENRDYFFYAMAQFLQQTLFENSKNN